MISVGPLFILISHDFTYYLTVQRINYIIIRFSQPNSILYAYLRRIYLLLIVHDCSSWNKMEKLLALKVQLKLHHILFLMVILVICWNWFVTSDQQEITWNPNTLWQCFERREYWCSRGWCSLTYKSSYLLEPFRQSCGPTSN